MSNQSAEHLIRRLDDLGRHLDLTTTRQLLDRTHRQRVGIAGMSGNAAAGNICPLYSCLDTLKARQIRRC